MSKSTVAIEKTRAQSRLFANTEFEVPFAKFKKNKLAVVCFFILALMYLGLPFEGFIAPYTENSQSEFSLQPPHSINLVHNGQFIGPFVYEYKLANKFLKKYGTDRNTVHPLGLFVKGETYTLFFFFKSDIHLFGTTDGGRFFLMGADDLGRDLFSRIVYGAKVSLTIGFIAVFIALVGGILVGGLSGMVGGFGDWLTMRLCEVIILLPTFYLFLFLRTVMPATMDSAQKFVLITAIFAIPGFAGSARGIRNWVLSLKTADFVMAAKLAGVPSLTILFRHILPQFRGYLILGITLAVPTVILSEAGLSYLNLGITEPSVSWGMLMSSAPNINVLKNYAWFLWPAAIIILTVFCFFVLGFAIKDALDPKSGAEAIGQRRTKSKRVRQAVDGAAAQEPSAPVVVELTNVSIDFHLPTGSVRALHGLDLQVYKGEILAIAGESGCGKSVTLKAILAMVDPPGAIVNGSVVTIDGVDILKLSDEEQAALRGRKLGLITQEPGAAFNPLLRIGNQIAETAQVHQAIDKDQARQKAIAAIEEVGIAQAAVRAKEYPFQFSGGMLQRGLIAQSMINDPQVLLADEPTTALDPTTQRQILDLIRNERDRTGMAVVFVTHDLLILDGFADRVAVMYAGLLVENAPVADLMTNPQHPYTQDLLASIPRYGSFKADRPLYAIPGKVPAPGSQPSGCPYHPRCPKAMDRCRTSLPDLVTLGPKRQARCWLVGGQS